MNLKSSIAQALPLRTLLPLALTAALGLGIAACSPSGAADADGGNFVPPPPEVGVIEVKPRTLNLSTELPGRLEPLRVAQVRARVTGILTERVFDEGSDVKAGQLLYKIDAAPYQAALQSAKAQLAQAEAGLANANATMSRYKPLVAAKAVSQQEYDAAVAAAKAAQAQVAAGKAAVRTADINLGYTTVTAPIAGRIGRSLVTEGALVSQQEGTHLATIQQTDMLYLNISQPAAAVLQMRESLSAGGAAGRESVRVDVLLEDGRVYEQPGRLLFTDLTVDPGTSQVMLRAEIPNPQGLLLPGMYVRARLQQSELGNATLLPQQAVMRNQDGDIVMVVGEDGSVQPRPVTVAGSQGPDWVVTGGLQPGELVMVDGAMKVAMGAQKVQPVPWKQEDAAPDAAAEAADGAPAQSLTDAD